MSVDEDPGRAGSHGETPDAARAALARVRANSSRTGVPQGKGVRVHRHRTGAGHYSGSGPDDRDPQTLGIAWVSTIGESGWGKALSVAKLNSLWPEIVGTTAAEHAQVESFDSATGVLLIRTSSTTWAAQLRLMTAMLRTRIEAQVGTGVVTDIKVAGPVPPSWVKGKLRVKGRGPRDTYG